MLPAIMGSYHVSTAGGVCLPPFLSESQLLQGLSRPTRAPWIKLLGSELVLPVTISHLPTLGFIDYPTCWE